MLNRHFIWVMQNNSLNLSISIREGKEITKDSDSNGEWTWKRPPSKPFGQCDVDCATLSRCAWFVVKIEFITGENPIRCSGFVAISLYEWGCLIVQSEVGGKPFQSLNMRVVPIANKYREGKLKSTLKREWQVCEIVERKVWRYSNEVLSSYFYRLVLFVASTDYTHSVYFMKEITMDD